MANPSLEAFRAGVCPAAGLIYQGCTWGSLMGIVQ